MASKRSRILILIPVGLIAALGIALLALGPIGKPAAEAGGFGKPGVSGGQAGSATPATGTPPARATNTRRAIETALPARTQPSAPTSTPRQGGAGDVDELIGAAIDTMRNGLQTYHFELVLGRSELRAGGNTLYRFRTLQADVENPDKLNMSWQEELSQNGQALYRRTRLIRIGEDVWISKTKLMPGEITTSDYRPWQQHGLEDVGAEDMATLFDVRPAIATAKQVEDVEVDGVPAHHIIFTLDVQKLLGDDVDLSSQEAEARGELWIAAEGGHLLAQKVGWRLENPDTGAKIETTWDGKYSAFDEPLDIHPPADD